jgi:hypothetical protein
MNTPEIGNDLAKLIVRWGMIFIILISALMLIIPFTHDIIHNPETAEEAKENFQMYSGLWKDINGVIFPLLGAWVGAVVAFFFSKSNYEAANKQAQDLIRSSKEKLKSTSVLDVMIPATLIRAVTLDDITEDKSKIVDCIIPLFGENIVNKNKKITRVPVLNKDQTILCVIHKSIAFECAYYNKIISLDKLLQDPHYGKLITAMVFVSDTENLATVQEKMKLVQDCQDAFVTKNGNREGPILGWITNAEIAKVVEL